VPDSCCEKQSAGFLALAEGASLADTSLIGRLSKRHIAKYTRLSTGFTVLIYAKVEQAVAHSTSKWRKYIAPEVNELSLWPPHSGSSMLISGMYLTIVTTKPAWRQKPQLRSTRYITADAPSFCRE
jgi:hypothetical protein